MTFFYQLDAGDLFVFQGDTYRKVDEETAIDVATAFPKPFNAVERVFPTETT